MSGREFFHISCCTDRGAQARWTASGLRRGSEYIPGTVKNRFIVAWLDNQPFLIEPDLTGVAQVRGPWA